MKKIKNFIKKYKKQITIITVILLIIIIGLIVLKHILTDNSISIEIAENNVTYIYGPNNETIVKMKINERGKIKVLTNNKDNLAKCYSKDNNIVSIDKLEFKAQSIGDTEIYCKLINKESNKIKIKVGE